MKKRKTKICFAASSGGHLEQLMMLKPLMDSYDSFIVTERTSYCISEDNRQIYFLRQVNRRENKFLLYMIMNMLSSIKVFIKEKPDVVICTGVLAMIPMCLLIKLTGGTLIYVESFAKVTSATETGKFLYKFADQFYVQWEQMLDVYPDALYLGGIY